MNRDTSRPNAHTQYKVETQKQEFLRDIPQNLQLCIAFENYGMLVCQTLRAGFTCHSLELINDQRAIMAYCVAMVATEFVRNGLCACFITLI